MSRPAAAAVGGADHYGRFNRAIEEALDLGGHLPCAGRDEWVSEDADERAGAARKCAWCSVFEVCGQTARATGQRFGVWAGADFGSAAGRRPSP